MTMQPNRQELWSKIETAQRRNTQRAADQLTKARDNVAGLVQEHPFVALAGGIAVGALLATLLPKSSRRRLGSKAASFAGLAVQIAGDYGLAARKTARTAAQSGQEQIERLGTSLVDSSVQLRDDLDKLADTASDNARKLRNTITNKSSDVAQKVTKRLHR